MIWISRISAVLGLGGIGDLIKLGAVALVVGFGGYKVGSWIGHKQGRALGVEEQKDKQAEADLKEGNAIRERVKDALDELGADPSDDDVDRILRGLAASK